MELHQIRYFLSVAEKLNFTHAADECNVAQPSLSRAIKKLEAELDGELFRRERGLTHLTELGRLMLRPLSCCLENVNAAKDLAAGFKKDGAEPLRIAVSNSIELDLLRHPLTELVRAFPGLDLQVFRGTASEIGARLKCGEAEVALACPLPDTWERLDSWKLFSEGFQLVAPNSHPVTKQNAVALDQLRDVRLIPRRYCEQFEPLVEALSKFDATQCGTDTVASDQDMITLLSTNIGVSIMPSSARLKSDLQAIQIHDLNLTRPVTLYAVSGRKRSQAAAGLLNLLRSTNWKATTVQQAAAPTD